MKEGRKIGRDEGGREEGREGRRVGGQCSRSKPSHGHVDCRIKIVTRN